MKNKKLLLIMGIVLMIIVGIVLAVVLKRDNEQIKNNQEQELSQEQTKVTGKLADYIKSLTDNYYIKYSGKFKDDLGKPVDCIVEYTKDKDNFALRSDDINMHMVCKGTKLYSISHAYEIVVEMSRKSFDISEYNLASDIGQTYVKTYKEKVGNKEYEVEEYSFDGKPLKYYFEADELKLIRYNEQDIKILRLERKTDSQIFVMPVGYTNVQA